jgi:5-formyltetrahydrofolate cyclo-ligase
VNALRSAIRRKRAELSAAEVADASLRVARHLWHLRPLSRARRIAGYVAIGGEVDCAPSLAEAAARGRLSYLPVVHGEKLVFAPADAPVPMVRNRFGIPEPAAGAGRWLRGMELDVVLTPLVAFDGAGHRIGMGGGFYDRSFGFVVRRGRWRRPFLVGLAYEFQRVDAIASRRWDVPLHAVVTERGAWMF